ncbi:MAG: efflux RND transporter periplasmic adaptor subunit [Chitinophagaceae bacterium]
MKSIISILTVAGCLMLASCGKKSKAPAASNVVPVRVAPVILGEAVYYDEYPATVNPLDFVNITPQVSGYVTAVHFKDGQHVEKGQLLYSLDQQLYKANVLQAEANYRVAVSNLELAQQDADRYLFLQQRDAVARQILDHALSALQVAKMQLEAAAAAIENVRTLLRYSTIYSPNSGTIGISLVKPGASVSPGVTVLNTVSTDDPVAVDFNLDEKDISRFQKLAQNPGSETDSTFLLALPGGELYPISGEIDLLDRAVDTETGTIKTRLKFRNPENELRAGMTCAIRVRNKGGAKQLLVPSKSITEQLGEYFVFVVGADTVRQQKVQTGRVIGDNIIINGGLKEGELVVTDGTAKLKSGSSVSYPRTN